jgi:hypothetical protein
MTWIEVEPSETCSSRSEADDVDASDWEDSIEPPVAGKVGRGTDSELGDGGGA